MKKRWLVILIPVLALLFLGMGAVGQYNGLVDSYAEVEKCASQCRHTVATSL